MFAQRAGSRLSRNWINLWVVRLLRLVMRAGISTWTDININKKLNNTGTIPSIVPVPDGLSTHTSHPLPSPQQSNPEDGSRLVVTFLSFCNIQAIPPTSTCWITLLVSCLLLMPARKLISRTSHMYLHARKIRNPGMAMMRNYMTVHLWPFKSSQGDFRKKRSSPSQKSSTNV